MSEVQFPKIFKLTHGILGILREVKTITATLKLFYFQNTKLLPTLTYNTIYITLSVYQLFTTTIN